MAVGSAPRRRAPRRARRRRPPAQHARSPFRPLSSAMITLPNVPASSVGAGAILSVALDELLTVGPELALGRDELPGSLASMGISKTAKLGPVCLQICKQNVITAAGLDRKNFGPTGKCRGPAPHETGGMSGVLENDCWVMHGNSSGIDGNACNGGR
jgi:hypothetical protein